MNWLTPLGFLGLIGLIILIIIYIIKPNYQQKFISSTFLWKLSLKYTKKKIPLNQLRNILIFICQVLIITSMAAILAQPFIAGEDTEEKTEQIVIIDASASMRTEIAGESRFERAVAQVRDLAEEVIANDGKITVIVAGAEAYFVVQRAGSEFATELRTMLDDLVNPKSFACTWGDADIEGAIELAEDITMVNPKSVISLYTGSSYIKTGKVNVVDVSDPAEWNAAILDVRAVLDENHYRIEVDVASYNKDANVRLNLDVNGVNILLETYNLAQEIYCTNNETTTAVFDVTYLEEDGLAGIYSYDTIHAYINEGDNFGSDDSFYLYGGRKQPITVQYYSTVPNNFYSGVLMNLRESTRGYWEFDITEIRDSKENVQYGQQKDYEIEGFDIYIFEHFMPPAMPTDGLVILANPDSVPAGAGFTLTQYYSSVLAPQSLEKQDDHPLIANMTVSDINVTRWADIPVYEDYDALMWCNGAPIVLSKNTDAEKVIIIGLNLNYSNFPVTKEFPIFFYNMLNYYFPETISDTVFEVDETIELNARGPVLELTGPSINEDITEFPKSLKVSTPGIYTLLQVPISGVDVVENFYVRIPVAQSNTEAVYDELTNPYFPPVEEAPDMDLVFYFALALVSILFIEWWLQSREYF